ncbi:hypothetical protein AC578_6272 [Pseudocercospora eumusae]|uniref:Uncharacterized protein n=1 Tax=Pseudocercospora eumusae TaxID=321146 RepID=A0A139H017_9PEZI|nr:hypothetical protein AC578_6272 [Pseudocercospora eumusae]
MPIKSETASQLEKHSTTPSLYEDRDADRHERMPAPCYLLDIAAELRNEIYELTFTTNETEVDLLNSKPPSPALLQCCKQISEEAAGVFKAFVHHYYERKQFRLALNRDEEPLAKLEQVARRFNFQSMEKLRLEFTCGSNPAHRTIELEANKLMWCCKNPVFGTQCHFAFVKLKSGRVAPYGILEESEAKRRVELARIMQDPTGVLLPIPSVKDQVEFLCREMLAPFGES